MFLIVRDKVLDRGADSATLQSIDVRRGEVPRECRIFRERLKRSAAKWRSLDVDRWSEETDCVPGFRFFGEESTALLGESRVEGCGDTGGVGQGRCRSCPQPSDPLPCYALILKNDSPLAPLGPSDTFTLHLSIPLRASAHLGMFSLGTGTVLLISLARTARTHFHQSRPASRAIFSSVLSFFTSSGTDAVKNDRSIWSLVFIWVVMMAEGSCQMMWNYVQGRAF